MPSSEDPVTSARNFDAHARAARSLAAALKDLINLERQTIGLDKRDTRANRRENERPTDHVPLAARLARLEQIDEAEVVYSETTTPSVHPTHTEREDSVTPLANGDDAPMFRN